MPETIPEWAAVIREDVARLDAKLGNIYALLNSHIAAHDAYHHTDWRAWAAFGVGLGLAITGGGSAALKFLLN